MLPRLHWKAAPCEGSPSGRQPLDFAPLDIARPEHARPGPARRGAAQLRPRDPSPLTPLSLRSYGRVIHEFDPWFNYRATKYLADNGLARFFKWFDYESWYPLGRPVG